MEGDEHWRAGVATGAQLLWRMPKNLILPGEKMLGDGSYLSRLYPSASDRKKGINGIAVRVILDRRRKCAEHYWSCQVAPVMSGR